MEPLIQLLRRNRAALSQAQPQVWINPPSGADWNVLEAGPDALRLFCQDQADWRPLALAGASVTFGAVPDPDSPAPASIILTLPREKERLRMMAHHASHWLGREGRLFVAGEIRAGIKSSVRHLQPWFERVRRLDHARHCVLVEACRPRKDTPFRLEDYAKSWRLELDDMTLEVWSWPGVFAHGALDEGTRLLLEHLPTPAPGQRVLDFACGAGVIAVVLARRVPGLHCQLSDASALACLASRRTLEANGLDGEVIASDGLSNIEGRFDLVVSNPPFHVRHKSVMALSPALLDPVRNFLNPGGQFIMVANRHLPYRRWLDEVFGRHEVVAATSRFHVLSATIT